MKNYLKVCTKNYQNLKAFYFKNLTLILLIYTITVDSNETNKKIETQKFNINKISKLVVETNIEVEMFDAGKKQMNQIICKTCKKDKVNIENQTLNNVKDEKSTLNLLNHKMYDKNQNITKQSNIYLEKTFSNERYVIKNIQDLCKNDEIQEIKYNNIQKNISKNVNIIFNVSIEHKNINITNQKNYTTFLYKIFNNLILYIHEEIIQYEKKYEMLSNLICITFVKNEKTKLISYHLNNKIKTSHMNDANSILQSKKVYDLFYKCICSCINYINEHQEEKTLNNFKCQISNDIFSLHLKTRNPAFIYQPDFISINMIENILLDKISYTKFFNVIASCYENSLLDQIIDFLEIKFIDSGNKLNQKDKGCNLYAEKCNFITNYILLKLKNNKTYDLKKFLKKITLVKCVLFLYNFSKTNISSIIISKISNIDVMTNDYIFKLYNTTIEIFTNVIDNYVQMEINLFKDLEIFSMNCIEYVFAKFTKEKACDLCSVDVYENFSEQIFFQLYFMLSNLVNDEKRLENVNLEIEQCFSKTYAIFADYLVENTCQIQKFVELFKKSNQIYLELLSFTKNILSLKNKLYPNTIDFNKNIVLLNTVEMKLECYYHNMTKDHKLEKSTSYRKLYVANCYSRYLNIQNMIDRIKYLSESNSKSRIDFQERQYRYITNLIQNMMCYFDEDTIIIIDVVSETVFMTHYYLLIDILNICELYPEYLKNDLESLAIIMFTKCLKILKNLVKNHTYIKNEFFFEFFNLMVKVYAKIIHLRNLCILREKNLFYKKDSEIEKFEYFCVYIFIFMHNNDNIENSILQKFLWIIINESKEFLFNLKMLLNVIKNKAVNSKRYIINENQKVSYENFKMQIKKLANVLRCINKILYKTKSTTKIDIKTIRTFDDLAKEYSKIIKILKNFYIFYFYHYEKIKDFKQIKSMLINLIKTITMFFKFYMRLEQRVTSLKEISEMNIKIIQTDFQTISDIFQNVIKIVKDVLRVLNYQKCDFNFPIENLSELILFFNVYFEFHGLSIDCIKTYKKTYFNKLSKSIDYENVLNAIDFVSSCEKIIEIKFLLNCRDENNILQNFQKIDDKILVLEETFIEMNVFSYKYTFCIHLLRIKNELYNNFCKMKNESLVQYRKILKIKYQDLTDIPLNFFNNFRNHKNMQYIDSKICFACKIYITVDSIQDLTDDYIIAYRYKIYQWFCKFQSSLILDCIEITKVLDDMLAYARNINIHT